MSRRVTLTRIDGAKIAIDAAHVETVAPETIEVEPDTPGAYPKVVEHFSACGSYSSERTHYFLDCTEIAIASGTTLHVREPADEVAALVWPVAWQVCETEACDWPTTDAPDGFAPIGPWEPHLPGAPYEDRARVVWRRPLRRVVGGAA